MNASDLTLISVDDHIIEPPDVFTSQLPERYLDRDDVPHVVRGDDGADYWVVEGERLAYFGLNAVAGKPRDEYGLNPDSYEDMRLGCYEPAARVDDMNACGVLASLNFPTFPQFCGQRFMRVKDKDFANILVRAYNDWHIDAWCGSAPGRFIPCGIAPLWDPELMAAEVRRLAAKDCHAVTFSENPAFLGLPSFHSDHWDPFWQACSDEGTVVCLHIGSSSKTLEVAADAPIDVTIAMLPVNNFLCATDLTFSPVLRKFPDLRIAMSEGGIGWVPYFLERIDFVYEHHHAWTGQDFGDRKPSELFLDQVVTCFISDRVGLLVRDELNIDNLVWECDYPHSDSVWPDAPEIVAESMAGVEPDDIAKITHRNAMRIFSFDPFVHLTPAEATVGALRAQATHIDTSPRSSARRVDERSNAEMMQAALKV